VEENINPQWVFTIDCLEYFIIPRTSLGVKRLGDVHAPHRIAELYEERQRNLTEGKAESYIGNLLEIRAAF
jgi:hypothetical protein